MANQYLPGVVQIPSMLLITNITQSYPAIVSFTVPSTGSNTYVPNQLVRLTVPKTWGMFQANGLTAAILTVGSTTMTIDLNTSNFDAFVVATSSSETPASLAPAGSRNLTLNNSTNDVPFQSLNNIGN
jgi:hypothetical protein